MPMRGALPARSLHPSDVGQAKNAGQVIKELIGSDDFTVVSALAVIGLLVSLCLIALFPVFVDVIAFFAQFP
jgi:hypothetical protein